MFNIISNSHLGKKIISKIITRYINQKLNCESSVRFSTIETERLTEDKIRIHLDLAIDAKEEDLNKVIDQYL